MTAGAWLRQPGGGGGVTETRALEKQQIGPGLGGLGDSWRGVGVERTFKTQMCKLCIIVCIRDIGYRRTEPRKWQRGDGKWMV